MKQNILPPSILKFYGYLKKDFVLLYKRKKYLYLFILLPLIIASLFLFALNPSDYKIEVAVCDLDGSQYSQEAISSLTNFNPTFIEHGINESCEGVLREGVIQGEYDLGLLIPERFSENIEDLEQSSIKIYYDNTDVAFSNLISWKVDQALNPFKRSIIGELNTELKSRIGNVRQGTNFIIDFSQAHPAVSARVRQVDEDLKVLENMETEFILQPIYTERIPVYDEDFQKPAGITFIFPIIALFILLMLASTSVIYDKKSGFITRVKSSTSPGLYVLAKTLFFVFLSAIQFLLILLLFILYGSSYSFSIIEAVKLVVYIGLIDSLLGFIIGFVSENEGIAVLFSLILAFPLMLISGIFFPIQTLPRIFQWLAKILPLHYQIESAKSVLLFNQPISINWFYVSLIMFLIVWWLARKREN